MAATLTEKQMRKLKKGDAVDAIDKGGLWGKAHVCDVQKDGLMIHFDGFKKTYDELMIWKEHMRICPSGSIVVGSVRHQNFAATVSGGAKGADNIKTNKAAGQLASNKDAKGSKGSTASSKDGGKPCAKTGSCEAKSRGLDAVPGTKLRITSGTYEDSVGKVLEKLAHGWYRVDIGKGEIVSVRVGMFDVISVPKAKPPPVKEIIAPVGKTSPRTPNGVTNGTSSTKRAATPERPTERQSKRSRESTSEQVLIIIINYSNYLFVYWAST